MAELKSGTQRLGFIYKCTIINDDGSLVHEPSGDAVAEAPYSDALPLRCLKTGRVLFAAPDLRLPRPADAGLPLALFTASLDKPYDVKAAPPPEAKPQVYDRPDLFQLSPDEARVAVLSGQGLISIVELATGKVEAKVAPSCVLPAGLPVWRSNQELCFVAQVEGAEGAKGRPEVVLWTSVGVRAISKDWPEAVRKGWLDR